MKRFKIDENLSIINRTKNPTKGGKKVQDGKTQILANSIYSKERISQGEQKEIK